MNCNLQEDGFVQEINKSTDSTRKRLASLLGLFALTLYIEVECMFMIRNKIDSKTCQYLSLFPLYLNSRVLLSFSKIIKNKRVQFKITLCPAVVLIFFSSNYPLCFIKFKVYLKDKREFMPTNIKIIFIIFGEKHLCSAKTIFKFKQMYTNLRISHPLQRAQYIGNYIEIQIQW